MTTLSWVFTLLASVRGHMRNEDWIHAYFVLETAMDVVEEAIKEESKNVRESVD